MSAAGRRRRRSDADSPSASSVSADHDQLSRELQSAGFQQVQVATRRQPRCMNLGDVLARRQCQLVEDGCHATALQVEYGEARLARVGKAEANRCGRSGRIWDGRADPGALLRLSACELL